MEEEPKLYIKFEDAANGLLNQFNPMQNCALTLSDFDKICRTCLTQSIAVKCINDMICENIDVKYLLVQYAAVQVTTEDNFPKTVCATCLAELMRFHTFRLKCQYNEKVLSKIVQHEAQDGCNLLRNNEEDTNDHFENDSVKTDQAQIRDKKLPSLEIRRTRTTRRAQKNYSYKSVKCRTCLKVFSSTDLLKKHWIEAKHPKLKNRICNICGKMFVSSKLKQHMRVHTKEKPYLCPVCSQGFSVSGNLKRHMMTHTGERPHVCEICGKGFIQATSLANHLKTHTNKTKREGNDAPSFVCNICGRVFKRMSCHDAHVRKHMDFNKKKEICDDKELREYVCNVCKRAYKTKTMLKTHYLTHGEKKFLCSDCGKGFITKAALLSHLKVHTGEKPHTCNVCQKSFAHVGSFEAHMLIHTGQRPYVCDICTKSFTQLTHLKYHLRTHSGERPYMCSYCGKSFALKGNLTVHTRIHTGETPYMCSVCGKGFYDSSSMKKHQKGHGNIDSKQQSPITGLCDPNSTEKHQKGNDDNLVRQIHAISNDFNLPTVLPYNQIQENLVALNSHTDIKIGINALDNMSCKY